MVLVQSWHLKHVSNEPVRCSVQISFRPAIPLPWADVVLLFRVLGPQRIQLTALSTSCVAMGGYGDG